MARPDVLSQHPTPGLSAWQTDEDLASLVQRIESLERADHCLIDAVGRLATLEAEVDGLRQHIGELREQLAARRGAEW